MMSETLNTEKPFYKSKKFVYAVSGFVSALIVALLPSVVSLEPPTLEMLKMALPAVIAFFGFVLVGHQWMDAQSLAMQAPPLVELHEAAHNVIEATNETDNA